MGTGSENDRLFASESVRKIIWKLAPPVMAAQLIRALYNIVDSFFIGRASGAGLTALSIIFPMQVLTLALAVGTGVGTGILISRYNGEGRHETAEEVKRAGLVLSAVNWILFCLFLLAALRPYIALSTKTEAVREAAWTYGSVVGFGSIGVFIESMLTRIHQAEGNMRQPMTAQITGAVINIILDPLFIFVLHMGVRGAAWATLIGQFAAAVLVWKGAFRGFPSRKELLSHAGLIYRSGVPSMLMQSLVSVYVFSLNLILASFSDAAVTVLGLYYKLQTFFFMPLSALESCIVPVVSFNYAAGSRERCRNVLNYSIILVAAAMGFGTAVFLAVPQLLIGLFTKEAAVLSIGIPAFRIISGGFISGGVVFMYVAFFQGIGKRLASSILVVMRMAVLLPLTAFLFSRIGLIWFWLAFPVSEGICLLISLLLIGKLKW